MEPQNSLEEENRRIREAFETLTRFYGALTSLNALARERISEADFLTRTISILIERAGFTAAGFYFVDGPVLRLGVHRITDPDQQRDRHPLLFSLDPKSPDSRTGTVRAFRSGIPVFIDDLQKAYHDAGLDRRAEDYRSIAFRSTGLCPFVRGGEIVGVFAVVSDRTHYFTPEIRELLLEASRIISFTLDYIDAECARRQSEEDFRTLVDALPDGVWLKDGKGAWILANQAALNLLGWSGRTDWAGKTEGDLARMNPSFSGPHLACQTTDEQAWENRTMTDAVEVVETPEGSVHVIESRKVPLYNSDGSRRRLVVIGRDMTEKLKAEEERNLSERIFETSPFGIFISDSSRRIIRVNPAFTAITGWKPQEVLGKNSRMLAATSVTDEASRSLWEHVDTRGSWSGEARCQRSNGEPYIGWFDINALKKGQVTTGYFGIFSDITKRKEDEERIIYQAFHDSLTDLPNRRSFMMRLDETISRTLRDPELTFALGILDLDGFKEVNDRYGHPAGDELLVAVSQRLSKSLRSTDFLARFGGDEFAILFDNVTADDPVFERIVADMRVPVVIRGHQVPLSASLGLSLCPPDSPESDHLLSRADAALYEVKRRGRNGWGIASDIP
uniref:Diguanylate cyclase with PAS/PAC sensor n=1 Tax=Leptospirillum ferrodiazotrophum TaxID=412449 RepID=C6HU28_9BACT|nr:MAG: diguanylate cyclase with PAS/PAC sensor [Leptospirillum ferrodiazotrophum]